jgi:hypothetical protein
MGKPRTGIKNAEAFEAAIWNATAPYAEQLAREVRAWNQHMRKTEPDWQKRTRYSPRTVRRDDLLLHQLFLAYREITTSFQTLENIPLYLNHFPQRVERRVSRHQWLRYHVENYFHELYIFQNRVDALFTLLLRSYRKDVHTAKLIAEIEVLKKSLKRELSESVKTRGTHVHERRLDDASFQVVEAVELLCRLKGETMRKYMEHCRDLKMEKSFWMKYRNAAIKKWLDQVGKSLGRVLFSADEKFRFPSPSHVKR